MGNPEQAKYNAIRKMDAPKVNTNFHKQRRMEKIRNTIGARGDVPRPETKYPAHAWAATVKYLNYGKEDRGVGASAHQQGNPLQA